jgi:hypothetical protein
MSFVRLHSPRLSRGESDRPRSLNSLIGMAVLLVALHATNASAQAVVQVNDEVHFRVGALGQAWADSAEDATTKGHAESLFLRRIRLLVTGQIGPAVSLLFQTDSPNLGKAPKAFNGFVIQDALVEWKPVSNAFMLDAGLLIPPFCRNCLESASSQLALDFSSYLFLQSGPTQSVGGRDTGFQAMGYLAGGHLEYRAGVFQGFRQPDSRNPLRTTARLQYDVWDTETGYVYPGTYLGTKNVLAVGAGVDHQMDYEAWSVDGSLSKVMPGRNALNGEIMLFSYDGGTTFPTLPEQKAATMQAGYYLSAPKVMPFLRLEQQAFRTALNTSRDNKRMQAGLTWYRNGNNFNIKGAWSRVAPRAGNQTSEFTIQMQFFYY